METMRIFVAADLDSKLKKRISSDFLNLGLDSRNLRIVPVENLHITFRLWSNYPMEKLDSMIDALDEASAEFKAFNLNFKQAEILGGNSPRALIIKPMEVADLLEIFSRIDKALLAKQVADRELRVFNPHLTLARTKKGFDQNQVSLFNNWHPNYDTVIDRLVLIESTLTSRGSVFNILLEFKI